MNFINFLLVITLSFYVVSLHKKTISLGKDVTLILKLEKDRLLKEIENLKGELHENRN